MFSKFEFDVHCAKFIPQINRLMKGKQQIISPKLLLENK